MYNSQWYGEEQQVVINNHYRLDTPLGKGAQGNVTKAFHLTEKKFYGLKKLDKIFASSRRCLNALREIKILKGLNHPNIIQLKEIIVDEPEKTYSDLYLVTEVMENDLKWIIYSNQDLSVPHIKTLSFQIAKGIAYLHSKKIFHRDLKPANILVNQDCTVKICDFGMAKPCWSSCHYDAPLIATNSCNVITRWYRPPEVLFELDDYDLSCDVWSFGCILAEMFLRKPFLRGENEKQQIELIVDTFGLPPLEMRSRVGMAIQDFLSKQIHYPKSLKKLLPMIDDDGIDLLEKIFVYNYKTRISADEVLAHPFFGHQLEEANYPLDLMMEYVDDEEMDFGVFKYEGRPYNEPEMRKLIVKEVGEFH